MERIKIIHIDDEVEIIDFYKAEYFAGSTFEYLGGFFNAKDALDFLKNNKVDLIFCDVEMPNLNGLWLANNLPNNVPIVFITAHGGFAVDAFEACALHYLIKPLTKEKLAEVVERFIKQQINNHLFKEQVNQFYNQYLPQNNYKYPSKVYINNVGKIIIVNLHETICLTGAGVYTKFSMEDGSLHVSSKNLKIYTDALVHHPDFIRIHRSYLVNKNYVTQIHKGKNQQWFVEMKNKEKLELSKGRIDEILELLQS